MKKFIVIFLLLPIKLFAQDISGVWTGSIFNDTTQKSIPYEIAINENNGKLTGFSHVIFLINGKEETGVKTVKIKRKDDRIFIEDEELIYNNYAERAPKGVKQRSTLTISGSNANMILSGPFTTNRTKDYYPVTGTIKLIKKQDPSQTKIIPKLSELNLLQSLSFLQQKNDDEDVALLSKAKGTTSVQQTAPAVKIIPAAIIAKNDMPDINPQLKQQEEGLSIPEKVKTSPATAFNTKEKTISKSFIVTGKHVLIAPVQIQTVVVDQPKENKKDQVVSAAQSIEKNTIASLAVSAKPTPTIVSQKIKEKEVTKTTTTNISVIPQPKEKVVVKSEIKEVKKPVIITEQEVKKKEIIVAKAETKISPAQVIAEKKQKENITDIKSSSQNSSSTSAADLSKRKIETIKNVYFKSDSLTLTLYDNGEVDGDTVSIILNGKVIMPRVGLSTVAIKKTIYITPDLGDSLQIIMYAENLGSIPPNTGLLILQDDDDRYEIRFAGDLQKNSAITLRRKKSE